jgi:hypothetical protein
MVFRVGDHLALIEPDYLSEDHGGPGLHDGALQISREMMRTRAAYSPILDKSDFARAGEARGRPASPGCGDFDHLCGSNW